MGMQHLPVNTFCIEVKTGRGQVITKLYEYDATTLCEIQDEFNTVINWSQAVEVNLYRMVTRDFVPDWDTCILLHKWAWTPVPAKEEKNG